MKTKIYSACATMAASAFFFATMTLGASAAPPGPPPGIPVAKIALINTAAVLQKSKAGQDIIRQVNQLSQKTQNDLKAQENALIKEGQALQQQMAIMAADVKAKKMKDLQAKQDGFKRTVQDKENLIRGGMLNARRQIDDALGPILKGILMERGATVLLDSNAVVLTVANIDITQTAIDRLDKRLPSVKVTLAPLPPGMQAQQ